MVKVEFVDGTEETIETIENEESLLFFEAGNVFRVVSLNGFVFFPKEFIKSIREFEV